MTYIRATDSSDGGWNGIIIHDTRTLMTSFMVDAFSSEPKKS